MRKRFIIILITFFAGMFSVQSMAQLSYGGGVFYGTYLRNLGVELRAEYPLTESLIVAPKLALSLPDFYYGVTFLNELCGHVHYKVFQEDPITLYPLAGICISNYTDIDTSPADLDIHFKFGVNLGAGGQFRLGENMDIFAEARYTIGYYHQFVATAGLLITPSGSKDSQKDKNTRPY